MTGCRHFNCFQIPDQDAANKAQTDWRRRHEAKKHNCDETYCSQCRTIAKEKEKKKAQDLAISSLTTRSLASSVSRPAPPREAGESPPKKKAAPSATIERPRVVSRLNFDDDEDDDGDGVMTNVAASSRKNARAKPVLTTTDVCMALGKVLTDDMHHSTRVRRDFLSFLLFRLGGGRVQRTHRVKLE